MESYFLATISVWDGRYSAGFSNPLQLPNLLFGIFSITVQYLGVSIQGYEQLLFYIWFAGSGLSAYVLCRVLGLERIARISGSLFYMMNPFSLILIWNMGQGMIEAAYAFMPLVVGLFLYGLVNGRGVRYCLGLQLLWFSLGLFGPAATIQLTMVYWVTIVTIFVSFSLLKLAKRNLSGFFQATRFTSFFVLGFALLNLFWLLPTLLQIEQYFNHYVGLATTAFVPNLDVYIQNSVQMANALRLMGYWAFPSSGWEGGSYYPWAAPYSGVGMMIITFVPLFLIILGMRRLARRMLLLLPPYLVGLLLIAGVNPPFGALKEFIFVNFPYFQTTRLVMVTWGILVALCSAPILGFGVDLVYKRIDSWGKLLRPFPSGGVAVFSILFLVIGVLVFPFWTGAVIQSGTSNFTTVDQTFEVPNYYNQLEAFINSQPGDFRILSLPLGTSGHGFYDWQHGYDGPDPTLWFSNQPVVSYNDLSPMRTMLARGFAEAPLFPGSLAEVMAMMNIKYIVVHNDAEWRLIRSYEPSFYHMTPSIIKDSLNAPNIKYIGDIGNLSIYENSVTTGHVYASVSPVILKDGFENVREVLPLGLIGSNSTIITGVTDPTEPQLNIGTGLTQVLNMSTNKAAFFIPQDSALEVYINAVESPSSEVLIDGSSLILSGNPALNLIPSSNIAVWSANGCFCNHFSTTQNQTTWQVNLSGTGDRNISFDFQSFNLTSHNVEILMDGDGSGSKISFQIYDNDGNFVGWNRVMNWNGTRLLDFSLNSIEYYSGYPNPNNFNASQAKLLAIYYYPIQQESGYSTIIVRSIHPSLPSDSPWSTTTLNLARGWHTLQLPQGQSGAGNLVIASRPQTMTGSVRPPSVTYVKISATEYRVNVVNASNPFYLVFSESFDQGWRVYSHELPPFGLGSSQIVSENNHFVVNGFANGWYVDKTGTYTLTLYFYPQVIYEASLVASGASFFAMVIIVAGVPRSLMALVSRRTRLDTRN